jgi:hypothetical protein
MLLSLVKHVPKVLTVEPADGKAAFQMILPRSEMLFDDQQEAIA